MKKFLSLLLFFLGINAVAQIGIGTTDPHASSALDITSDNTGILIPRVDLGDLNSASPIENPEKSLLVWNTDAANLGAEEGFYFWNGEGWNLLMVEEESVENAGWGLAGNNIGDEDFLGTTNWSPIRFKVNNVNIGACYPNGGIALGFNALANPNHSVAIGTSANASNNNEAVSIGVNSTASAYRSTAVGYSAQASNGNESLAVGNNSEATAQNSSALGNHTSASGQNSTAIGYGAVAPQANTLILGNESTGWESTKVGIGTSNPTEKLQVNGSIKIVDGNEGNDKVLASDADGKASWVSTNEWNKFAEIYKASGTSSIDSSTPIFFGTTSFSQGINVANNHFQIIEAGIYRVNYNISIRKNNGSTNNTGIRFYLATGWNSSDIIPGSSAYVFIGNQNGETQSASVTKLVHLEAYQQLYVFPDSTHNQVEVLPHGTSFSIELVQKD